ncbi:MAG TPA: LacI family DNA-binding transcriptional regulator [Micromonosporaceae bacterium]|nr:LacI family DNA-binding transcriptional regulator [Micromonosporaceae bacterium]
MSTDVPPPRRAPTLEVVARTAGVSRATVSRVINGVRNVDPQIAAVVQRAIATTGYVPNRAARALVTRRTFSVALVVSAPDDVEFDDPFLDRAFTDPFFGRVASGALAELADRDIHMILMRVNDAAARAELLGHLRQGDIDGVMSVPMAAADPLPRLLTEARVPAVLFGRPAEALEISYVDAAQAAGAAIAADHLVARGCRRIATICGPADTPAGADRLAGFREAMARHGQSFVPMVHGNFTHDDGESAMLALLGSDPDLDGLFVANDLMAQGAMLVLRDAGRRVPEDIAVVGFDDSVAALSTRPKLTTVRQPVEEMAAAMVRLLLNHIEDRARPVASLIFEPTLVIRDSA